MAFEGITPRYLIEALGPFDLDPCAAPMMPWPTARRMIAPPRNGLTYAWYGNVWLSPPMDHRERWFMKKLFLHGKGIALLQPKTETLMFHEHVWHDAHAVYFFDKRIRFYNRFGIEDRYNHNKPNMLVAYGVGNADRLLRLEEHYGGKYLQL